MPDVVVVKEIQEDAVSVVLPRLCGGFLGRNGESCLRTLPAKAGARPVPAPPGCPAPGAPGARQESALLLTRPCLVSRI